MDVTNEAMQFWRDMRLWSGIIGALLVAGTAIITLYSNHRLSLLEEEKKKLIAADTASIKKIEPKKPDKEKVMEVDIPDHVDPRHR